MYTKISKIGGESINYLMQLLLTLPPQALLASLSFREPKHLQPLLKYSQTMQQVINLSLAHHHAKIKSQRWRKRL